MRALPADIVTSSTRLFLAFLIVLAQAIFAAHAFECADDADHHTDYHHTDTCQVCHLAERNDDATPPIQFSYLASASTAKQSNAFANDVVSEKTAGSANPRAPPLPLNEE